MPCEVRTSDGSPFSIINFVRVNTVLIYTLYININTRNYYQYIAKLKILIAYRIRVAK